MSRRVRAAATHWAYAVVFWAALGFSLGWYYTFTYYGHAGWPMPMPESCNAIILYYFSVLNVATEGQAVHWMLAFPAAGALWAFSLHGIYRCLAHKSWLTRVEPSPLAQTACRLALATLPIGVLGPWMAWLAGASRGGFSFERMMAVALRRGNVSPWPWLTPLYFGTGLLCLVLEIRACRRSFPLPVIQSALHFVVSVVLLTVLACLAGALLGLPLRLVFE